MKSAIFIDFDNVYITLDGLSHKAATSFSQKPSIWLQELQKFLSRNDNENRNFLIKRCYLNPGKHGDFRTFYTRAGFEVIDCPSLTSQHKNSADIYCVIDILDALKEYPHVEEFVILSADADFTPIVTRLRKHDKRTVIFASANAASAYKAVSDDCLSEMSLFRVLLRDDLEDAGSGYVGNLVQPGKQAKSALPPVARLADGELRVIADAVVSEVRAKGSAPLATIANIVRLKLGSNAHQYGGFGNFRALLSALPLDAVKLDDQKSAYVLDGPQAQTAEAPIIPPISEALLDESTEMGALANRISAITDVPAFPTSTYNIIFNTICDEIKENNFGLGRTPKGVVARMIDQGITVKRQSVEFILRGINQNAGDRYVYSKDTTPHAIAGCFQRQIVWLCDRDQVALSHDDLQRLIEWIRVTEDAGGEASAGEPATGLDPGSPVPDPSEHDRRLW